MYYVDVEGLRIAYQRAGKGPPLVHDDLHAKIPGSTLVVFPGIGHMVDMEAAEPFNTEVRQFLRAATA